MAAETLALTSGVAGLMTIAMETFRITKAYVASARRASKAVKNLIDELADLKEALWQLEKFFSNRIGENDEDTQAAPSFENEIKKCETILLGLRDSLLRRSSGSKLRIFFKSMAWPFSEKETNATVQRLQRRSQIFQMCVNSDTNAVARVTQEMIKELKTERKDEKFRKMLSQISGMQYEQRQDTELHKAINGSADWLLNDEKYKKWKCSESQQVLWCPGDPGCGKTVAASLIVQDIQSHVSETDNKALAYIFGDYKNVYRQTSSDILACIAKQIAAIKPAPTNGLLDLTRTLRGDQRHPSFTQSKALLSSLCEDFDHIYIVIDAIDELEISTRTELLSTLMNLKQSTLSILFTGRSNCDSIRSQLENASCLPIKAKDEVIKQYVRQRIDGNAEFRERVRSFEENLISSIVTAADGMFLYVVLQMNRLMSLRTATQIRQNLSKSHSTECEGLAILYEDSIQRVKDQERNDADLGIKILRWLVFAKMPMSVCELLHALAVDCDDENDIPSSMDCDNLLTTKDLADVCAGLITIEKDESAVRLVHATAQDYLIARQDELFPSAEAQISKAICTYLSFEEFSTGHRCCDEEFEQLLEQYPFLTYAACKFGDHLLGQPEVENEDPCLEYFQDETRLSLFVQIRHSSAGLSHPDYSQSFPRRMNGLHFTALLGLEHLNNKLLGQGLNPTGADSLGRIPLHYASGEGNVQNIKQMAQAGFDVLEHQDEHNETALHLAVIEGKIDAVKLLIGLGASIDLAPGAYSPLHLACRWGHDDIVQLLLEKGANPISAPNWLASPLHMAAETGHMECARKLITSDANIDFEDNNGRTPCYLAVCHNHTGVAQLLLSHGASVDSNSLNRPDDMTMLQRAAWEGQTEMMGMLLEAGASAESRQDDGKTALYYAVIAGQPKAISKLSPKKSDILNKDAKGHTLLDHAAYWQVTNALFSIISTEAEDEEDHQVQDSEVELTSDPDSPSTASSQSRSPESSAISSSNTSDTQLVNHIESSLHTAAWDGDVDTVQALLDEGTRVDSKGISDCTALHRASARGHVEVVRLLLSWKANSTALSTLGYTALEYAALNGQVETVRILLGQPSANANFSQYDNSEDRHTLHQIAFRGQHKMLRLLIHAGADCRVEDEFQNTPLHFAAKRGATKATRVLLTATEESQKVRVDARNHIGQTPLHQAARYGHRSIVELLLAHGADKDVCSRTSCNAREMACIGGHRELVQLLT